MMPKPSLFAEEKCGNRRSKLGDLLVGLSKHVDFSALADEIDIALPRPSSAKCGRPPYTTELMTKILILQQLYNLADNALEYQLLGRRSLLKAAPTVVVNKPIFDTKKQRNRRIATPRTRGEHVFGAMRHVGGKLASCMGTVRATFALHLETASYNLQRLVYLKGRCRKSGHGRWKSRNPKIVLLPCWLFVLVQWPADGDRPDIEPHVVN
jgi:hypothetical protein